MPRTYSLDLRTRVLNDCLAGLACTHIARKYSVSRIWVHNLKKQYKEIGSIEPKKCKRGQKQKLAPYEQEVRQLLADHPDTTLVELCEKLSPLVTVCPAALGNFLQRMKITYKKTLCAAEQHREDVAEQRDEWQALQKLFDIKHLVFIDETWTKTNHLSPPPKWGGDVRRPHFWLHYVMMV